MRTEILKAVFGVPLSAVFAIAELLKATDYQGRLCPGHECCSQTGAVIAKIKSWPHGLQGDRFLVHVSLSPHSEYVVQNHFELCRKTKHSVTNVEGFF